MPVAGYDKGTMTLDAPRLIDVTVVLDGPQLAAQDLEVSWHARHLLSPSAADCATRRASAALSTRADPRSWCGASHRADTEQVPVKGGGVCCVSAVQQTRRLCPRIGGRQR